MLEYSAAAGGEKVPELVAKPDLYPEEMKKAEAAWRFTAWLSENDRRFAVPDVGCGTNHNLILRIPADQMNAQPDDAVRYVVFVQC